MSTYPKRLLFGLLFATLSSFIILAASAFLSAPYPHNQTEIVAGDTIEITGPAPISFVLYATQATEETGLSNPKESITTHAGAMPGYYEATGVINPERYQVTGSTATLILSASASVDNPGVRQRRQELDHIMAKAVFALGLIFGLLISPLYFR